MHSWPVWIQESPGAELKQPELERLREELLSAHAELRKKDIELRYLQEDLKRGDATITSINLSETLEHVVADYAAVIREKKAIVSGNILPTIFGQSNSDTLSFS